MLKHAVRICVPPVVLLVLAACGGSLTAVPDDDAGAVTTDGGRDAAPDAVATDGGRDSAPDTGASCADGVLVSDTACVPGVAKAGSPIVVDVRKNESCFDCFATHLPCKVTVAGAAISISLQTRRCPPDPNAGACPPVCLDTLTQCTIPALAAGSYTVTLEGEGVRSGIAPRTLVVAGGDAGSAAAACTLPPQGSRPSPLDGAVYPTACRVDSDCVTVTTGDLCALCRCPDRAIAKSALATYEADARARSSQCPTLSGGPVACAGCAVLTPKCQIAPGATQGVCKAMP